MMQIFQQQIDKLKRFHHQQKAYLSNNQMEIQYIENMNFACSLLSMLIPILYSLIYSIQISCNISFYWILPLHRNKSLVKPIFPYFLLFSLLIYNYQQQSMAKYQHIPDGTYQLKEEHVEDAAQLLVSTFIRKNVVWSNATNEHLKFKQFFIDTISNHLELQKKAQKALRKKVFYNTFAVEDGFMTSCSLHYDIEQYRLMLAEKRTPQISLFTNLQQHGAKLMEQIDLKSYEEGKTVYATFGGRSTQKRVPKISSVMMLGQIYVILKSQGYRYVIGRISSDQLRQLYEQLGLNVVASIAFDIGKGKQHILHLGVLDLENPVFLKVAQEIKEFRNKGININPKL